jgi:hypothetical protein
MPTTQAPSDESTDGATDTTGTMEGAMDDILGGSTDDTTGGNGGNGGNDMGRGRSYGNGPRR